MIGLGMKGTKGTYISVMKGNYSRYAHDFHDSLRKQLSSLTSKRFLYCMSIRKFYQIAKSCINSATNAVRVLVFVNY